MDRRPQLEIGYGKLPVAGTDKFTPFLEVTNAGDRPIAELRVEWVVAYEAPQEVTEEFQRLHGDAFAEATGEGVQRAEELGGRYRFLPQGAGGPLKVGATRRFVYPPEGLPAMQSTVQSLSPERYFVAAVSDGHEDVVIRGERFGEFISRVFG
jgi:hypothetical protein